ncbi:acylphosphatase [Breznakiella homolactica]|uniref:Acylphosphatase n=1 Tax=Breznakiella homolactica TaxID=2798577 RepID=A0A7T8BAS6_9SPIR|nr:acylphosphatase [Breznakiella homolactica]QQO09696.1 acylphosphatase [Breznakiella homolactica]
MEHKKSGACAFFAVVSGTVQGVGFRYSAFTEARRQGLCGWVRNTSDGTVEVFAQGPKEKTEAFLRWLRHGPPGARVESLHHEARNIDRRYSSFTIDY